MNTNKPGYPGWGYPAEVDNVYMKLQFNNILVYMSLENGFYFLKTDKNS